MIEKDITSASLEKQEFTYYFEVFYVKVLDSTADSRTYFLLYFKHYCYKQQRN